MDAGDDQIDFAILNILKYNNGIERISIVQKKYPIGEAKSFFIHINFITLLVPVSCGSDFHHTK